MKEKGIAVTDERREITRRYSTELIKALQFEKQINEDMRRGNKRTYFVIRDATGSHSGNLEIGEDLVKIAQGVAFGAYRELAFKPDKQVNEETGGEIKVVDPDGKAIADYIIKRFVKENK